MINRHPSTKWKTSTRVVASFGQANLVRIAGANYELRGASDGDLTAAKEWVSLFMHEACVALGEPVIPHPRAMGRRSRMRLSAGPLRGG
jgi:hypothetical protein